MSKDALKSLIDWFEIYIKHRDIILKKIISIHKNDNILKVTFKDKVQVFHFYLNFSNIDLKILKKDKFPSLVLLNSERNLSDILTNWNDLITIPFLSIYLVNPFSETDKKWIIYPYTHHQISEKESLAKGLRALFESVDHIDEDNYLLKI